MEWNSKYMAVCKIIGYITLHKLHRVHAKKGVPQDFQTEGGATSHTHDHTIMVELNSCSLKVSVLL